MMTSLGLFPFKLGVISGSIPSLNATALNASALQASIYCKRTEKPLNTSAKAVIALLSVFCTLAVLGSSLTVVKYFKEVIKSDPKRRPPVVVNVTEDDHHDIENGESSEKDDESLIRDISVSSNKEPSKLETFLSCFCVFTNGAKLLNTDSEGQLQCIHGIIFLSMCWVILGDTYSFCFQQMRNAVEVMKLIDSFPFQVVLQYLYSVDTYFVLSGFLVSYLTMKDFDRTNGVISWPYFYIHRYVRLTPLYMVVLGFSATVFFYLGSGPYWPDNDIDPICRDNWWRNLIYIYNFGELSEMCMPFTWFSANEMQFFIVSPLFLITLWRWPKIGYGLIGTFLCACWVSNFVITYHFELSTGLFDYISDSNLLDLNESVAKYNEYFSKIFIKPYTRMAPFLIGMLVGYLLFKHEANKKPKYSWVFLCIGWLIATTISLACVYGQYHHHPTVLSNSFFNAFHETAFAIGPAWVIFVCVIGQGGFVNSILSYKLFLPLSRLTGH